MNTEIKPKHIGKGIIIGFFTFVLLGFFTFFDLAYIYIDHHFNHIVYSNPWDILYFVIPLVFVLGISVLLGISIACDIKPLKKITIISTVVLAALVIGFFIYSIWYRFTYPGIGNL